MLMVSSPQQIRGRQNRCAPVTKAKARSSLGRSGWRTRLASAILILAAPAAAESCNPMKLRETIEAVLAARDHLFEFEETEPVNAEAVGSLHEYLRLLAYGRRTADSCTNPDAQAATYRLLMLEQTAIEMLSMANKAAAADFDWMIRRERVGEHRE